MARINLNDLSLNKALDRTALSAVKGGSDSRVAGNRNTVAIADNKPMLESGAAHYTPYFGYFGPRAFQLSYHTSFEQAYYSRAQTSYQLKYFQA